MTHNKLNPLHTLESLQGIDPTNASRRSFLRTGALMGGLGGFGAAGLPFALNLATMASASAQTAGSDYRAVVCIFFFGGNDAANSVLATDTTSWNEYTRIRTTNEAGSIALPAVGAAGGVLPIAPTTAQSGRSFALHPNLTDARTLFDAGRLAIVANTGTMVEPLTKAEYRAGNKRRPAKLFSHNDQQSLWQSYAPEGARVGWGGRMGDLLMSQNSKSTFTTISAAGNAVFLAGQNAIQYQVSSSGAVAIGGLTGTLFGSTTANTTLRNIITADSTHLFEKEHSTIVRRSIDAQADLSAAMAPAGTTGIANPTQYTNPVTGALANNGLATQLQTVARIIAGRSTLGAKRQVFFVSIGGFDTHDFQRNNQSVLMAQIGHALAYFDNTLATMPGGDLRNQVTTFTASDFGRTFTSNGDGTDHGWGSHHFVMGGAVKGKDIYGRYPITGINHDDEVGSGSLLPQISVDQYGATLGKWMGLSSAQLDDVFPNLRNFALKDLGFMR